MPVLLFSLRHVPTDEADEVRDLLTTHHIDFYETHTGSWGTSIAAIWLPDNNQELLARQLLQDYQQQRTLTQQQRYLESRQANTHTTFLKNFQQHPWRNLLYLLAAAVILYLSAQPFAKGFQLLFTNLLGQP